MLWFDSKKVKIILAQPGWYCTFYCKNDDGYFKEPVALWALYRDEDDGSWYVSPLIGGEFVNDPTNLPNYAGVWHESRFLEENSLLEESEDYFLNNQQIPLKSS